MNDTMIVDCEKMNDRELLHELTKRVIAYDELINKELVFIGENDMDNLDEDGQRSYEDIHLGVDNAWCRIREVVRIVKKDPNFWA